MENLIEKAKKGDINSFTKIIEYIEKDLYRIAYIKLKNDEDINDAIQNTMIATYKNIKKLKENAYFKTWIIKILINECNKIIKDNLKRNKVFENYIDKNLFINTDEDFQVFLNFNSLISKLDSTEQLIFSLYYKDKFSCKEISKITNLRIGTVKSKLSRGRNKLEQYLKKEEL